MQRSSITKRLLLVALVATCLMPVTSVPASATHGDSADEMFFYRDDGLFRYYNVQPDGNVGSPILAGDEYTKGWSSITAVDLDGDGQDEMFFYRDDGLFRYYDIRSDGTIGTPINSGDNYTKNWTSITAVDLDGDGQDEMFFYRDDGLFRYYDIRSDGTIGSPLSAGSNYTTGWDSISAIDLDGDGQDEMFFYRDDGLFRYYDIRPDGSIPKPMLAGDNYTTGWSSITAVDLDGDGQDEVFFYRGDGLFRYYNVRPDGHVGSPILAGANYTAGWSSITAVDLDDTSADRGFHPFTIEGNGNNVISLRVPGDVPAILDISYSGPSNFIVWSLDGSHQLIDLLVNEIGTYDGRRMVHGGWFFTNDVVRFLDITASGPWTITVSPISAASVLKTSMSGSGDNIVRYAGTAATLTSTHNGSSNFIIVGYESDGEYNGLIVNEIGSYSGTDLIDPGTTILDIQADGNWTLHAP
jgi:hypothetical protein